VRRFARSESAVSCKIAAFCVAADSADETASPQLTIRRNPPMPTRSLRLLALVLACISAPGARYHF